jgi:hypothetical protein
MCMYICTYVFTYMYTYIQVRFHFAQAFMLSIIQFIPSLGFGLLEKAGVPNLAILYNTGTAFCRFFIFEILQCILIFNTFFVLMAEISPIFILLSFFCLPESFFVFFSIKSWRNYVISIYITILSLLIYNFSLMKLIELTPFFLQFSSGL